MPIGAPDHTRLSDDAYSHYIWTRGDLTSVNLNDGIETTLIDDSYIGVLGVLIFEVNWNATNVTIYVDGNLIDQINPFAWWDTNKGAFADFDAFWGMLRYDDVNPKYTFLWNPHFKCYVKRSFKVTGQQWSGVMKTLKVNHYIYLERK